MGINKLLNNIAHNSIFTLGFNLLISLWDSLVYLSLPDQILDQFYVRILFEIYQKIK